jgi:hypothetical protein
MQPAIRMHSPFYRPGSKIEQLAPNAPDAPQREKATLQS